MEAWFSKAGGYFRLFVSPRPKHNLRHVSFHFSLYSDIRGCIRFRPRVFASCVQGKPFQEHFQTMEIQEGTR